MKADTPNAAAGRVVLTAGTAPAWPSGRPGAVPGPAAPDAAAAVTGLYQGHAVGLIRLALVMVGDRPAAEDIVQDTFTGLYRRWAHLADPGKAPAYLRSATINGCRNELRRRLRARRRPGEPVADTASAEFAALVGEEHRGTNPASDRPGITGLAIAEFPARTGAQARPVRTLDPITAGGQLVLYREVLWSNADGSVLIATGLHRLDSNAVIGW